MSAIAYQYPDEVVGLREGLTSFIRKEVIPLHEKHAKILENDRLKYTEKGGYSPEVVDLIRTVRMKSAEAGYYTAFAPTELGGAGLGMVAYFGAWERVAHMCGPKYFLANFSIGHWASGPSPVIQKMTPQAREEIFPAFMSGEKSMCFGMSEPGTGSDATQMKTRADKDGDGWRLNGGKIWTTHSPFANYAIVFAVTDQERAAEKRGGISAFLVPTTAEGFSIQQIIRMWGHVGGNEAVLHFDNVRIEPYQLVGELNEGFRIAMLGVNIGKIFNSASAIGRARWALEQGFEYAKLRHTFGKPIAEYQGVTFPLAEASMHVLAAHCLALNVAQLLDAGHQARKELAMCKGFAVQTSLKAIDVVMQTHGAIGMTNEMHLTEAFIGARLSNIADGTNEIIRRTIVKEMLGGDMDL
ncbi:MAG TPA: acyl-CoA dehydrogenase family protein [Caulobacteraceae bacterium]|jgi:acyl-CoA dehydrogenase|nr:acyl-CoA dehydrogenase family protein [Caulobacteraceae bacterium]